MQIDNQAILEAIRILKAPEEVSFANACGILESIGFEGPMYSAGPLERLLRIIREEILPGVKRKREQFNCWVDSASIFIRSLLDQAVTAAADEAADIGEGIAAYIVRMKSEGLAGPDTARVVILCATADALMKLTAQDGTFQIDTLTTSEWLMISFAFLRLGMDAQNDGRTEQ